MAEPDKTPVTMEELLVSSLAQTDALAKLLIEKGADYGRRISECYTKSNKVAQKDRVISG